MRKSQLVLALAAIGFAGSASATNGYFSHGVGTKSQSMGGVGIAYAEDGFGIGANPATLSQVKAGYAVGASLFSPDRSSRLTGGTGPGGANLPGGAGWIEGNDRKFFLIPEFAYAQHGANGVSYGVAVYGNGGMNADYDMAVYDMTGDKTFTNLMQLFIAPTISKKINDKHAVAASLNIAYQRFEAGGLDMFTQYTRGATFLAVPSPLNPFGYSGGGSDPGDHGVDSSYGFGLKFGWTGKLSDTVTVGAFYQSETYMSKFDKYKDLFAENGKFNIPATYGLGIAFNATPQTMIAFDVVRIAYEDINSISNTNNHIAPITQLGTDDGKGFGWDDMTVFKVGIRHQLNNKTALRAGWNHGKQPISSDQLDFNLLAPAVVEDHLTLGISRVLDNGAELTVNYLHAFNNQIDGTPAMPPTGTIHVNALEMSQNQIGVQYSKTF